MMSAQNKETAGDLFFAPKVQILIYSSLVRTARDKGMNLSDNDIQSHTKPEPNATKGILRTVTEQKQEVLLINQVHNPGMTFEIKIPVTVKHMALFSGNHANPPNNKWHSIRRKSNAKRKFYRGNRSFHREKCVF